MDSELKTDLVPDTVRLNALAGDSISQFELGSGFYSGGSYTRDLALAAEWFSKAANQGHPEAQACLGWMYFNGEGVPRDFLVACTWLTKALAQGASNIKLDANKFSSEAALRRYAGDLHAARASAEAGDAGLQSILGLMYHHGDGVLKNYEEAAGWYFKAAVQGNADAQTALGWMYFGGAGVLQDDSKALEWFSKAAKQGDAEAQRQLGSLYYEGRGRARDLVLAYTWIYLGYGSPDPSGDEFLTMLAEEMHPEQVAEAQRLIRDYAEAIEGGHPYEGG